MATKVKGDAIKEGSIPMSALNDEVRNKIENAGGGADWNAKEGEAGYIENKPFYETIDGKFNENDFHKTGDYIATIEIYENPFYLKYYDIHGDLKIEKITPNNDYIITTSTANIKINYNFDNSELTISDYDEIIGIDTIIQSFITYVTYGFENQIAKIKDAFIPNTVLKTTPQELSDTDKNQALSNLGIDPIVWNYMCNPLMLGDYISEIPLELRDIILGDYSEEFGYTLKPIASSLIKIFNGAGFTSIATFGNGQDYNIDFENNKFIINNDYEIEFV